tara:strand:- start:65 stop:421 length:357 start_codon:yes stop_codon:yes gene_type:complete
MIEQEDQEAEVLLLNRQMLTEVRDLIDDINLSKPSHLKQFMHPQWGSIVGSEKDIRLAALSDEVEIWEQRVEKNPDTIPYLGYIRDTLKGRVKELELVNHVYDQVIQEHEMTWGKEYE